MSLHRLVYYSRQTLPPDANLDSELAEIVAISQVNNREVNVTGLLLVVQDVFLQVLEGEPRAVQTTFGRILQDRRHACATVVSAGPVFQRAFGRWDMCLRTLNHGEAEILDVLKLREPFDPRRLTPHSALRLLTSVAQIQNPQPVTAH
jgi:hypothetical protein